MPSIQHGSVDPGTGKYGLDENNKILKQNAKTKRQLEALIQGLVSYGKNPNSDQVTKMVALWDKIKNHVGSSAQIKEMLQGVSTYAISGSNADV